MHAPPTDRLLELAAINRAIAAATDYDALLRLVVERTAHFLDAEAALVVLADERGRAGIPASRGVDPEKARAFAAPFDDSVGVRICEMLGCTSDRLLAAPVIEGGTARGFLAVFRRPSPARGDDSALLSALADHVAIALGNAMHLRRLEQALEALRDADRRKDEFLGMLSHELRNPLSPIRTSIFLLKRAEAGSEDAAYARGVIERQTEHLTRLIDDLLDMTRIARGKLTVAREPIDVAGVVRRAADDHRSMLRDRGLEISVDIPGEATWALGDATRLAQVVANLLDNAAKFTPSGGRVDLSVRPSETTIELRVRDDGEGIDPSLGERVFEPFVQTEQNVARTLGGLGLGLALVKAVVELHGGTVRAESEGSGKGAEFIVSLPRVAARTAVAPPAAATRQHNAGKHVLVVDDNRDAADSLARLVEIFGHRTSIAYDGPSALEMARASIPDVILCDIGLPGMNGYELARALRAAIDGAPRLIAVSGYARAEDVRRAIEAGFDAHVAKPPDPAEINRLLA
jgi:signal transduction histidine kinase